MCTYTNASKFFFFNFRALTFCNHCCNLNFGYAAACWLKLTWTRVVHLYAICAEDLQPISKTKSIQNKNNNNKSKHFNNQRTASVCIARVSNSNLNFSHTRTHTCTHLGEWCNSCNASVWAVAEVFRGNNAWHLSGTVRKPKTGDFIAATCLSCLIFRCCCSCCCVLLLLFLLFCCDYRRQLLNCICIFSLNKYYFYLIWLVVFVVANLIQARLPFTAVVWHTHRHTFTLFTVVDYCLTWLASGTKSIIIIINIITFEFFINKKFVLFTHFDNGNGFGLTSCTIWHLFSAFSLRWWWSIVAWNCISKHTNLHKCICVCLCVCMYI